MSASLGLRPGQLEQIKIDPNDCRHSYVTPTYDSCVCRRLHPHSIFQLSRMSTWHRNMSVAALIATDTL